ncbi:ADP-ribosyltransferase [Nocardiopsis dassonvillei]
MPLDHNMSDSSRGAIKVLTGIEVPKAGLATLGRGSEVYAALEKRIQALDDLFDLSRVHARRHFDGRTARNYERSLDQFTTGDNDYVGSARSNAATMSSELFKARANVEYMHMMVIGQFVQLLAEIAWAIATAKFTFGASLKWIPIFKAIRSLAMRRILTWLLITVPGHQIISQIFASMDSIIQRIQIGRGTRHHKDPNLTRSAHIGATIEGALSAVFSAGLDGLFSKQLTDLFSDRVARITDLPDPPPLTRPVPEPGSGPGGPPTGPPTRETPDGPPTGPPTGPPPDPRGPVNDTPPPGNPNRDTDAPPPPGGGPDGPPSGPVKDDPPATNPDRGPDSPAPKDTPGADLPAPSLNKDLAEVFVRHKDEFLVPYNPASPIGAGVFDNAAKAAAARNEFGDLFARHFGDHIGQTAARDLGRDYADTLARNWTDPNLGQHLRDTIGDRLPPTTRDHLSDVPVTLQQPLNDYFSKASTYAQQTGGSIGTGALEGYLGEGLGSMADGRGWEASVWSATAGASQAGIQQGATDGILHGADLFKDKDKPDLDIPPSQPRTESNGADDQANVRTTPPPGRPADTESLYDSDSDYDSDVSSVFDRDENSSPYDSDDEASLFDTDEVAPQQETTTEKPNGKPGPDAPSVPGPRDEPRGTDSPAPRSGDDPFPPGMNDGPLSVNFLNAIVPDNPMAAVPPGAEQTAQDAGNTGDRDTANPADRSAPGPERQHDPAPVAVAPPVGQATPPPASAPQNPAPDTGQRSAPTERSGGGRPSQSTGDTRAQDPSTRQTTGNGPQISTESAPPATETAATGDTTGQDDQVTSTDEQRATPHTPTASGAPSPTDVPLPPSPVTESGQPQDTEGTGHSPSERGGEQPEGRDEDTSRDEDRSRDGEGDRSGDGNERSGEESGDRSGDSGDRSDGERSGDSGDRGDGDRSGEEKGDGSDGKDKDGERADDDAESAHEEESTGGQDGQEQDGEQTPEVTPAETGVSREQETPQDPLTTGTGETAEETVRPPAPPGAETSGAALPRNTDGVPQDHETPRPRPEPLPDGEAGPERNGSPSPFTVEPPATADSRETAAPPTENSGAPVPGTGDTPPSAEVTTPDTTEGTPVPARSTDTDAPPAPSAAGPERAEDSGSNTPGETRTDPTPSGIDPRADARAASVLDRLPELTRALADRDIPRARALGAEFWRSLRPVGDPALENRSIRDARALAQALVYVLSDPSDRRVPLSGESIPPERVRDAETLARGIDRHLRDRHDPVRARLWQPGGQLTTDYVRYAMQDPADRGPSPYGAPDTVKTVNMALVDGDGDASAPQGRSGESSTPGRTATDNDGPAASGSGTIRRLPTEADTERYGALLHDPDYNPNTFDALPTATQDAVSAYTWSAWLNDFARLHPLNEETVQAELDRIREESRSHPGWQVYEVGGGRWPDLARLEEAVERGGLSPEQERIVRGVLDNRYPEAALENLRVRAGRAGEIAESLALGGEPAYFPDSSEVLALFRRLDRATGQPFPEGFEAVRGTYEYQHLLGEGNTDPYTLAGTTHVSPGYFSASLGTVPSAAGGSSVDLMRLTVPQGSRGLWVGDRSQHPREREVILTRGTRYQITAVEPWGRHGYLFHAQILPPTHHDGATTTPPAWTGEVLDRIDQALDADDTAAALAGIREAAERFTEDLASTLRDAHGPDRNATIGRLEQLRDAAEHLADRAWEIADTAPEAVAAAISLAADLAAAAESVAARGAADAATARDAVPEPSEVDPENPDRITDAARERDTALTQVSNADTARDDAERASHIAYDAADTAARTARTTGHDAGTRAEEARAAAQRADTHRRDATTAAEEAADRHESLTRNVNVAANIAVGIALSDAAASRDAAATTAALDRARSIADLTPPGSTARARLNMRMNAMGLSGPAGSNNPFAFALTDITGEVRDPDGDDTGTSGADLDSLARGLGLTGADDTESAPAEAPGPVTGTPQSDRTGREPGAHPAADSLPETFRSTPDTQTPPVRSGPVTGEESSEPGAAPSPRPVPTQSAPEPNTDTETTEAAPAETGVSREQETPPDPLTTGTGETAEETVRPPAPPEVETRVPTEEARTRSGGHEEGAPPPPPAPAPTGNDGTEQEPSVRPVDTDVTDTEQAPPPSPQHEHDTTAEHVETVDTTGTEQPAPPQQENTDVTAHTENTEQPPPSPQENTDVITHTEDTEQPPPPQQENTGTTTDTTRTEDTERTPPPPPAEEDPRTTTDGTETDRPQTDTDNTRQREEPPPRNYPGTVQPVRTDNPYDLGYLLTSNLVNSSMIHAEHLRSFVDDTLTNDAGHVDATVRDTVRERIDAQVREQTGVFFRPEGFSTTVNGADGSTWQAKLRLNPSRGGFHHAPTQPKEGSAPTDLKLVDEAGEANPAEGSGSHGGTKFIGMGFQVSPLLLGTVGGADIGPRFTFSFSGGTRQRQTVDTAVSLHDGYSSYEIKGKPEVYASDLTMSFELTPVHVPPRQAPASGTTPANRNTPADGTAPNSNTAPNDTTPPDRPVNSRAESDNGVILVLPGEVAANTGPETIRLRDPFATQDHQRGRNDDDRPVGPHADKGHPVSVGDIRLSDGSSTKSFPDWIADHLWSPERDRGWWKSAVDKVTPGFVDRRRQQKLDAFHDQVRGTFSKKSVRNNLPEMTSAPAVFTVTDPSGRPRLVSIQSVPTAYDAKSHTIQPAKYIKGNKAERESGSSVRHSDFLGGTLGAGVSVDAGAVGGTHKARVDAIAVEGGVRGRSTAESSQVSSGAVNRMNYGKTESSAYDVQRNYYVHFDGESEVYRFQGDTVEILTVQEARILNGDEPSDKVPAPPTPVRTEGSGTAPETVNPPGTTGNQQTGNTGNTGNQQTGTEGNRQPDTIEDQQTGTDGNRNAPDGEDRNRNTGTEERGQQRENAPEQERPPGQQPPEERPDGEGRPEALRPPRPNLAQENPVTFHGAVPRDFTWPDGSQYRDVDGQQRSIYQHIAHQVLTGLADKLPGIVLPDMARDPKNFARRPGHENTGPFTGSTREHRPFRRDHDAAVFNTHRIIDAIAASEFKSGTDGLTLHGQPVHLIDTGRFDPSALFKSGQKVMRSPFVAVRISADFSSLRHAGETKRGTGGEYSGSSEISTADGSQKRKTVRFSSGGYIRRIDAVDAADNPSDGGVFSVSLQLNGTKGKSRGLGMKSQSERTIQYAEDSSVWNSGVRFKARLYQDDDLGMVLGGDTPLAERGQDLLSGPIEAMATMDTAKAVPGAERGGRDDTAPAPQVTRIRPIPVDQAQEMIDGPTRPTPDRVRKTRDLTGGVKRLFGGGQSQRPRVEEGTTPAPNTRTTSQQNTTGQQNTGQQNTGSQTGDGQQTPAPGTNTETAQTTTPAPNIETAPNTETAQTSEAAQTTTGQQNTDTAADTTGQQDTGSQNDGVRRPPTTETNGGVRTPPATETTGDTTGQQNTDTAPAPNTETAQTTTGRRNPAENAPDTRPIEQRRAEKLRDTPATVEHVNTRFNTGDGQPVSSLLEATYESFSSTAPWERGPGGQRPSRGLGFERKLRHFLRRGEGSRRFYENALSPENLADNPAARSSGGARTRTETSGGPLSPMDLRTTSSTRFDIDSVDRFEQSDGAVVFKSKNTLETFSRDGKRTDLTLLATGGGRVNPNPIQPAEQPAGGTAPAPNSASAPLIQLGPSAGKSLFDRYTMTKPTSRFNESVEFHPKIPMSYSYSASGRITQALEFVKNWSIGPTFPRSARYRGWQADSDNLETGLIHIRDAHASGMVEDKVEEVDGGLVRSPQPEPETPGSVRPRPGFEDSGMMLDPVNPDEAIQSLVDDLASQGWQLTKGSREIILKALDSHTGLNPNTGVPVTLKISPIDHSIGNLNAPTTAPLSLDATVKLRLDRSNAKVEYLGGKTEYRQRQGSEEGDRLQQGNESSAFQGAHGSLLTPLPQSGGDQPGGTTPPSRPYLMGLQGDGTTTNARGEGGIVRDTDKRSTQLTMETPYARVSSDTQLTLDLHISEKQGAANSLLGETPGSRTRDFTGTGNSGRAQELYPAFSLDLRNEAGTTGGNDTPRTSTDGNDNPRATPEGSDTTRTTPEGSNTTRTTPEGNNNPQTTTDGNSAPRATPETANTTQTTAQGNNNGQPGGQRTGNQPAPENPSNDNHASLTDMARSLTRDMDPRTRDAFNDAVTLLASVENKGKDVLDLGRIVLAKSLGWNPPANSVHDGRYTQEAVEKAADYAADKLKLNSRNNAIDHALTELGIKASFAEASSETGAELPELGATTWMMRAIPHPETAQIKDYNPSMRLTDSSETSRTFSPFHNESSTTTMGFEARPSGRTGTGPPTTATHYGAANNTGSSTSGGDTARGSRPKEPPHSDRVRTGPGYLVEMDTDVFIGARTELSGPWYKRSARYVGDKAASAGRAVRGAFGGRSTPSSVPTRPARWQQGQTTVKTTRWVSHGDAVRMGVITPDHATRIAPLTERFARIQKALGDAEKAYLDARWPLDQAASDRVAAPDDPQVRDRYRNLEDAYEDRRREFEEAVRDWVTALQELRDGLGDPSSLPRPRTATAPDLDTIQEEPPPPLTPQQNAPDPAADPEAIELPERNNRQPGQEGRQPERGTQQPDTAPNLLDTLGSELNIRPREAAPEEVPPQAPQRNTPDPTTTEPPERDDRPQEDVQRKAPQPSAAEVLERARQKLARDMVMGRALQGQEGSSRNGAAPADNRPERHSRNQAKGPLSHTDQRSGPSSETHARPESATVRRPRGWATPTGEDGNGPSQHEADLTGDQTETRRGPAPERVDNPADRYTANDEENLYDVSDDEDEAPRPRWLDTHYPEAASLSKEERKELMRSLMERSLAVGPPAPEGFRYDMDLGGPDDVAWLEAQRAQRFPAESDTTVLPGPSTAPSAPQQQDRPVEGQDQRPQPTPSEDDALAQAAEDAVFTFDGQRLPLHTRTEPDHDTRAQPDQDTLSEVSSLDSDTFKDMQLRLERLRSSDPTPSEGDRPSPEDTGLTGDHGQQRSPDQTGTNPASENQPVPRQPQTPGPTGPSANPDRSEWDNRLQAMHDWKTNWEHRARTPEERDRLRKAWRIEWSLPATTRPGGDGSVQHSTDLTGDHGRQRSPGRTETDRAPGNQSVPQTETAPAGAEPRSPAQAGTNPDPHSPPQSRTTTQPTQPSPEQTPTTRTQPATEETSSPQSQPAPEQTPAPQPLTRNRDDEGSSAPPRDRTDNSRQEGTAPPAEQAPPASDPAPDLFAFFEQELNGPANSGDDRSAQDTAHAPSGQETATGPAPAAADDGSQKTPAPETAPAVTEPDPSRKQPEPEDGETAKDPEHTQDEKKKEEEKDTEEETEGAPTDTKDQRKDEDGDDGGPDKDGSGGKSGDRTGGDGGSGQDRSGGGGEQGGSGGSDRTGEGDRSGERDGSEGKDRGKQGEEDRSPHGGRQGGTNHNRGGNQARPDTDPDADPVPDLIPDTDSDGYDSDDDLPLYDVPDTPVRRTRGSAFGEPRVRPPRDQDGSPSDSVDPKSSDKEDGSPDALGAKPFPDDFPGLLNPKADFDQPLPSSMTDFLVMPVFGDDGRSGNPQGDPPRNPWGNNQAPTNPPADSTDRSGDGRPRGRGGSRGGERGNSRGGRGGSLPFRDRGGRGGPPPASGPAQSPARSGDAPRPPVAGASDQPSASAPPRSVWGGGASQRLFGDTGTPQPTGTPPNPAAKTTQTPAATSGDQPAAPAPTSSQGGDRPPASAPPRPAWGGGNTSKNLFGDTGTQRPGPMVDPPPAARSSSTPALRGDPDSAVNRFGLENTTTENHLFSHNLTDGRILGKIPDSRVTKDSTGKIVTVDGKPLEEFQFNLVDARAQEVRDLLENQTKVKFDLANQPWWKPGRDGTTTLNENDLGGEAGAVNSIAVDRVSGLVAEGMNGRKGASLIPANRLHSEITRRINAMREAGPYEIYRNRRPTGQLNPYPMADAPHRHAEIKAINALLRARNNARISDFQIDNLFTLKMDPWEREGCPCCANCTRITWGAPAPRSGKSTYASGHPDRRVVDTDWTPPYAQG